MTTETKNEGIKQMSKIIINIEKSKEFFDFLTDTKMIQWEVPYEKIMTFMLPEPFTTPEGFRHKGKLRTIIGLDVEAEIIRDAEEVDLSMLPYWMYPLIINESKFDLYNCQDEKEMNAVLDDYTWTFHLSCSQIPDFSEKAFSGYPTKEDLALEEKILNLIKAQPLRDRDYFYCLRKKEVKFTYAEFARELIKKYNIINVEGARLYFYSNGYYKQDYCDRWLESVIYKEWDRIKSTQKRDVIAFVKADARIESEEVEEKPYIINVKNGILDLSGGEVVFCEHSPKYYCFNQLPVTYNPDAPVYDVAYKSLDKTFNYNKKIMALFEEILGVSLIREMPYQKAFVFIGEGGCGKSTVIDMMQSFFGKGNYATLGVEQLQGRFGAIELENKLVNFSDDLDYQNVLNNTGLVKKIIRGNEIFVERKGQQGYEIKPYATQIWGANGLPKTNEMNYAIMRSFVYVPFVVNFTKGDPDYDPHIMEKLTTDECKTWLLNIAIKGLQRYLKNKHLTTVEESAKIMQAWIAENSPTQEWVDEEGISVSHVTSILSTALYTEFRDWAEGLGINRIPSNKAFYKEISRIFNVERSNPIIKNNVKGRFFEVA